MCRPTAAGSMLAPVSSLCAYTVAPTHQLLPFPPSITLSADSERTSVHLNAIRMQRTSSASADTMYVKYDDDVHTRTLLDCLHAWHMHGSMDVGHGAQSRLVDLFRHAQ